MVDEGTGSHIPSFILSHDKPNDFPLALLGCYKVFRSIASLEVCAIMKVF